MLKQHFFDKISQQIGETIKSGPLNDLESNIKAIVQAAFEKFDLVSREEFDIQQKVLLQTRIKLEELEAIIKSMEHNNR